jgi:hypothetical protein
VGVLSGILLICIGSTPSTCKVHLRVDPYMVGSPYHSEHALFTLLEITLAVKPMPRATW